MHVKPGKCVTANRIPEGIWRYFQVQSLMCCGAYEMQNSLLVSKGLKQKTQFFSSYYLFKVVIVALHCFVGLIKIL